MDPIDPAAAPAEAEEPSPSSSPVQQPMEAEASAPAAADMEATAPAADSSSPPERPLPSPPTQAPATVDPAATPAAAAPGAPSSSTTPPPQEEEAQEAGGTAETPAPRVRPPLKGTLIGPFVVLDPSQQDERVNMKRDLEVLGIHQRDMAKDEEVQLSLEQAFYLVEERQRLQVHLPGQPEPLGVLGCWRAFSAASPTFVRSVGSYRRFRQQGFVVHGGLNLGLDYMLYRGSPQKYHAEFGVLLRYPPNASAGEKEEGENAALTWRELHLLYRLIGEVRKTLVIAHVRLGQEDDEAAAAAAAAGDSTETSEDEEDAATIRKEMARWYTGLSLYEVAVTPWRAGTPLARMSKGRGEAAQLKRPSSGGGGGEGGPNKKGRVSEGGGGGGEQQAVVATAVAAEPLSG